MPKKKQVHDLNTCNQSQPEGQPTQAAGQLLDVDWIADSEDLPGPGATSSQ